VNGVSRVVTASRKWAASVPDGEVDVLIVGAGHGGAQAALALRQQKFTGSIAIVGAEPDLPYEKPPLSKHYLAGAKAFDQIQLRQQSVWRDQRISLVLGSGVVALDASGRTVDLENGRRLAYRRLIWAAGGRVRRLTCAGHSLEGVHSIRTRADVDRLRAELPAAESIVVIGGGYIGLEAAATLSKLEKQITVVESCERVLARVAGEPLSRFYETQHRAHGVDVRVNARVECIEGIGGRAAGVRLASSEVLPADIVIVGIGISPEVDVLAHAGARIKNGITVDSSCRTSLPDTFAIGDCAQHVNRFGDGRAIRLESVQNATDQANIVAKVIGGQPGIYDALPWFWSEQYDLRLQTVGLNAGFDDLVIRGTPEQKSFSVVYLRDGIVIALDCVNASRDYIQGKTLILMKCRPDRKALEDAAVSLKSIER
jgi:3-phenylpropionate/trans-cinnamate dioxygenase ferredoxin reductase component